MTPTGWAFKLAKRKFNTSPNPQLYALGLEAENERVIYLVLMQAKRKKL